MFRDGVVKPTPQSLRWNTEYGNQVITGDEVITLEEAREIVEKWATYNIPGAEMEKYYIFPGHHTFHLKHPYSGKVILSVNAYTGQVWLNPMCGGYVGTVYEET